jgi:hypothetical protein
MSNTSDPSKFSTSLFKVVSSSIVKRSSEIQIEKQVPILNKPGKEQLPRIAEDEA